jgi:hypothetical protein
MQLPLCIQTRTAILFFCRAMHLWHRRLHRRSRAMWQFTSKKYVMDVASAGPGSSLSAVCCFVWSLEVSKLPAPPPATPRRHRPNARQRQRQPNSSPPTASVRAAVQRCTQITPRPSVLHRAPGRAPRLTCPAMTPARDIVELVRFLKAMTYSKCPPCLSEVVQKCVNEHCEDARR